MRLLFDLGDGAGPIDYSAALAVDPPHSNDSTSVESFSIRRSAGEYARCIGTLDCAGANLQEPVAGGRVNVTSDTGAPLFSGVLPEPPQRVVELAGKRRLLRFTALDDAWLNNTNPDTSLQPPSATVHAVSFADHVIRLDAAPEPAVRAKDVIVMGADEPAAYVTELFRGDGTTATFLLNEAPFQERGNITLLDDAFTSPRFRTDLWHFVDPGSHLQLGSGGLKLNGGNGFDGQTYLAAHSTVELGGTLCAQMQGVLLAPGSDGVLLGFYGNIVDRANCFAGVRVKGTGGAQSLIALVNGEEKGSAFSFQTGHRYTLRLRLHSAELQRVRAVYQAVVNGDVQAWGGDAVDAPMQLVFEALDEGLASSTPATVLYAGAVSSSIARAIFAPVNSVSLVGSVEHIYLQQQGSAWVTTTRPDGTVVPQRPGTLDTGEDYALRGSTLAFFPGRVPGAGELVTVRYRRAQPSIARAQDTDALAAMQQQGLPALRREACRVTGPVPRSSADCFAAAKALLAYNASPATGVRGTCTFTHPVATQDVQPGDRIALPLAAGSAVQVPVEHVDIRDAHARPELLRYEVTFAQSEANGLSFHAETNVLFDTSQPTCATSSTQALPALSVTLAGSSALQVDAGAGPPVGGGFEVRRHDGNWGPVTVSALPDDELVLRSPVRSFSVPRAAFSERFYVRMYDGALPPVYSAETSLIVTHLPID